MKTQENIENLKDRAELLKALSSPRRLHILLLIAEQERVTNTDVKDEVGISQPDASFHLDKLTRAGVIDQNQEGLNKIYDLNNDVLEEKGIDLSKLINAPTD